MLCTFDIRENAAQLSFCIRCGCMPKPNQHCKFERYHVQILYGLFFLALRRLVGAEVTCSEWRWQPGNTPLFLILHTTCFPLMRLCSYCILQHWLISMCVVYISTYLRTTSGKELQTFRKASQPSSTSLGLTSRCTFLFANEQARSGSQLGGYRGACVRVQRGILLRIA